MRSVLAILMLLVSITPAEAVGQPLSVTFPAAFKAAPAGSGAIALQVEDARADKQLGKAVDGEALLPSSDLAASVYTFVAADLKNAGYRVVPYSAATRTMLIRIDTLHYAATKETFKSSADVRAALVVDMTGLASTYTFRSHVSDEYAWKPSGKQRGALVGEALASAVSAAFNEPEIRKALAGR